MNLFFGKEGKYWTKDWIDIVMIETMEGKEGQWKQCLKETETNWNPRQASRSYTITRKKKKQTVKNFYIYIIFL